MTAFDLVVYGADDVGAGLAASGKKALWIRPPTTLEAFPVSYVGNGEVERTAKAIFGDAVAQRLWDLSRENLAIQRAHWPGRAVSVRWRLADGEAVEDGWLGTGPVALSGRVGTLVAVQPLEPFGYELVVESASGVERVETSALVLADETLPPKLFPVLEKTWLLPACTELVGPATSAAPEGLVLDHAGVDYAFRHGPVLRAGSFRGLQDDDAIRRPLHPSARGVLALRQYYGDQLRWLDGTAAMPRVYEAALSCDGLPIVGPLSEAPGIFVVGAFAARERNFRSAAVAQVLRGLFGERSSLVEPYRPGRFS